MNTLRVAVLSLILLFCAVSYAPGQSAPPVPAQGQWVQVWVPVPTLFPWVRKFRVAWVWIPAAASPPPARWNAP